MAPPTFADTRAALARGATTCEAVVDAFLQRIAAHKHLNAFVHVDADGALSAARQVDWQRAAGHAPPLAGLVLAVKDVLCVRDWPLSCGSRMLSGFRSLYDATAVARLKASGAILVGTTNCDEFAMGSSSESSWHGPVLNPRAEGYVPGGSSGGSAVAVAAGLCHAALGSDTGGSIRQPAALCGVVGLKPTYGRVSRYGLVAYASSLDCVGPLTHTVHDAAIVLDAMAGQDERDATSVPTRAPHVGQKWLHDACGLRLGVPEEFFGAGLDAGIQEAIKNVLDRLRAAGAHVRSVSLPHTRYGVAVYYILATAEASSNLGRFDGLRYGYRPEGHENMNLEELYARARSEGFGKEVKRRIMLGTYVLSAGYYDAYYAKAQRVRSLIRQDFDQAFEAVDVLVAPVTPVPGFRLGAMTRDPLQMYLSDTYTVTANLAGVPGLAVPAGVHENGFPIGIQILGQPFDEARLLQLGDLIVRLLGQ